MKLEATPQQIEAARLAREIEHIVEVGHGYEGHYLPHPLASAPVPRSKPGFKLVVGGLRNIAYLQLH